MTSTARSAYGRLVREARLARDWTQKRLATGAKVSRALVAAVEHGRPEVSVESLDAIARALGGTLVIDLRVPLAIGRPDQRDAAHAACARAVRHALERLGYICVAELPFVDGRNRGWIDLVAFDPSSGILLVVEIKTELHDLGGLQRQVGWYARAASGAVRELGWRVRAVECLTVFLATDENDTALEANRSIIAATFPVRGRALLSTLAARGQLSGWGLAMIDPRRRGNRAWIGLRLDGRRRPAPYRSYADYMRACSRRPVPSPEVRRASRSASTVVAGRAAASFAAPAVAAAAIPAEARDDEPGRRARRNPAAAQNQEAGRTAATPPRVRPGSGRAVDPAPTRRVRRPDVTTSSEHKD